MLVWSMRCGSVLLLGLIGIEGTRVFRKNCSVTTIRFAKTKVAILGVFLFLGTRIGLMLGAMGGVAWARRLCGQIWTALRAGQARQRGVGMLLVAQRGRLDALDNAMS